MEFHRRKVLAALGAAWLALLVIDGCRRRSDEDEPSPGHAEASRSMEDHSSEANRDIPRFAANSPFVRDYNLPSEKERKRLWAQSFLWEKAPEFVAEQWLTPKPEMEGKYLLIEYWATWCPPCRRSIPLLNEIHRRFQDRLIVVGMSDEPREQVVALEEPKIEYHLATDTQARMKNALGVVGIPHAIVIEPGGYVVWEGFPLLEGQELTVEVVERILSAGRRDSDSRHTDQP